MTRETIDAKARRYLVEGRLTVVQVDVDRVRATCRGAGAVYSLGHEGAEGWWCSCPARGRCAHVVALELVVVCDREEPEQESAAEAEPVVHGLAPRTPFNEFPEGY